MAVAVNSDLKLEFTLTSGNKIQIVPNAAGFLTINLIAANASVLDTDSVDQPTAVKFQLLLQDFNNARSAQLRA